MIYFFHGENIDASRKELQKYREKYADAEVVKFDGRTITETDFTQATESSSLFGEVRMVIIENLFSKRATLKSKEIDLWLSRIKKLPDTALVFFWEEKSIGKTVLTHLPKNSDIALFNPEKSIFAFVETLKPGNYTQMLKSFDSVMHEAAAEFVFVMLVRQIRLLIMTKELGKNIGLPVWMAAKLTKQGESFTLPLLLSLYADLLTIDTRIKSGTSPFVLKDALELWLTKM